MDPSEAPATWEFLEKRNVELSAQVGTDPKPLVPATRQSKRWREDGIIPIDAEFIKTLDEREASFMIAMNLITSKKLGETGTRFAGRRGRLQKLEWVSNAALLAAVLFLLADWKFGFRIFTWKDLLKLGLVAAGSWLYIRFIVWPQFKEDWSVPNYTLFNSAVALGEDAMAGERYTRKALKANSTKTLRSRKPDWLSPQAIYDRYVPPEYRQPDPI